MTLWIAAGAGVTGLAPLRSPRCGGGTGAAGAAAGAERGPGPPYGPPVATGGRGGVGYGSWTGRMVRVTGSYSSITRSSGEAGASEGSSMYLAASSRS